MENAFASKNTVPSNAMSIQSEDRCFDKKTEADRESPKGAHVKYEELL